MQVNVETLKAMKKQGFTLIVIQAIIAVLLILLPNLLPNGIIDVIGIITAVFGGIYLYTITKRPKEFTTWKSYIFPAVLILAGLFIFIYTQKTWIIIAWIIGFTSIVRGVGTFFLQSSPVKNPRYRIFGIISIVIGVIMIILASRLNTFISYYIAAMLIYHVITDLIIYMDLGKFIDSAGDSEVITITK